SASVRKLMCSKPAGKSAPAACSRQIRANVALRGSAAYTTSYPAATRCSSSLSVIVCALVFVVIRCRLLQGSVAGNVAPEPEYAGTLAGPLAALQRRIAEPDPEVDCDSMHLRRRDVPPPDSTITHLALRRGGVYHP